MRQRVGDRALKELLGRHSEQRVAREIIIERFERAEESGAVRLPFLAGRVDPALVPFCHRERPIEQIAQVRENLRGGATPLAHRERREVRWRVAQWLSRAIRERGYGVSQKF